MKPAFLDSQTGDDGNISPEVLTPNKIHDNPQNFGSPESYANTPDIGKNPFKAETEGVADIEHAPLVKHPVETTSPVSPNRQISKPVTLSFKDLKYSVQIKNKGQGKDGPKCEF